jgi:hypothetical protein
MAGLASTVTAMGKARFSTIASDNAVFARSTLIAQRQVRNGPSRVIGFLSDSSPRRAYELRPVRRAFQLDGVALGIADVEREAVAVGAVARAFLRDRHAVRR